MIEGSNAGDHSVGNGVGASVGETERLGVDDGRWVGSQVGATGGDKDGICVGT